MEIRREKVRKLEVQSRKFSTRITERRNRKNSREKVIKEMITEHLFPRIQRQESLDCSGLTTTILGNRTTPRHINRKPTTLEQTEDLKTSQTEGKKQAQTTNQESEFHCCFSSRTTQEARRQLRNAFKMLRENAFWLSILCKAKVSLKRKGRIKRVSHIQCPPPIYLPWILIQKAIRSDSPLQKGSNSGKKMTRDSGTQCLVGKRGQGCDPDDKKGSSQGHSCEVGLEGKREFRAYGREVA